jgi:hypothetical protein
MGRTAEERGNYRNRVKNHRGYTVIAGIERRADGQWYIWSIGGINQPTSFLPFEILHLTQARAPFASLSDAIQAVREA